MDQGRRCAAAAVSGGQLQGAIPEKRRRTVFRQCSRLSHRVHWQRGPDRGHHRHHRNGGKGQSTDSGKQVENPGGDVSRHRPRAQSAAERHQDGKRVSRDDGGAWKGDQADRSVGSGS